MAADPTQVFIPGTLTEFFSTAARFPGAVILAGGTDLLRNQADRTIHLPPAVISIREITEIRQVSRTERYLDLGSAMTLTEIMDLGEKVIPPVLYAILGLVASPGIRNLATIGGNLLYRDRRMDLFAPLHLLDARAELRKAAGVRWLPVGRLIGDDGLPDVEPGEIVTRIRIPSEQFDLNLVRKLGNRRFADGSSAIFCCCARISKNILTDFRLAFSGSAFFRNRDIENALNGKNLPLSDHDIESTVDSCRDALEGGPFTGPIAGQLVALVGWALSYLTEKGYE